jgi:hypothetical protein
MKKLLVLLLTLMMVGLFMGCDDTDEVVQSDSSVDNNTFTYTMDLQGTIFDATDGSRLTGSSLTVTLTRGSTYYSPALLKKATTETTFAGDYAFTGIPTTLGGQVTYRIIVAMDGYQTFEGYITPNETEPTTAVNNNTLDTIYNMVGNVYLFPLGETAPDANIYVQYNNERIANATVYLEQDTTNNAETAETNNQLNASTGQLVNLSATTDANGLATFAGTSLVLGGRYRVTVLPLTYEGVQLALNDEAVAAFTVGLTDIIQVVNMGDLVPGTEDNGVYIVSASNHDTEDIRATGELTVVFSKPVYLVSEDNCTAALANNSTAALDADTCTASVSADGLTLTLLPKLGVAVVPYNGLNGTAGTNTADRNLQVTYSNVVVALKDDNQDDPMNVFTQLRGLDGALISAVVQMTSPLDD